MANLFIDDQGNRLVMRCHFFYRLLPAQFLLHEMQDKPISLPTTDTQLLKQNLSAMALVAFDLKIDGQPVQPTLLDLYLYPDQSCNVTLSYPGHPHGNAELRAPILQYFRPGYVISVSISSTTGTKGAYFGKVFPSVAHFTQGAVVVRHPPSQPLFSKAFMAELGTAWVNYNWILLCVVLLITQHPKQIIVLVGSILICWAVLCYAAAVFDYKILYKIPEIVLGVPTILLCLISAKGRNRPILFTFVTLAGGLLNACYDMQQIALINPTRTINALAGLAMGFAGGLALVLLVLVPLWWECKKYPGFQENWAPKASWAVAILSIYLPLQKWLFG